MGRKSIFFGIVIKQTGQNSGKPSSGKLYAQKGMAHRTSTGMFYGLDPVNPAPGTAQSFLDIRKEVQATAERVKTGDLSDIDRILAEQLHLMHAATAHYANRNSQAKNLTARESSLKGMIQCSRATRQIAVAIANIKNPKRFTVIEKQQNVMVNQSEAPGPQQLGESTNAPMDTRSQGKAAAADTAAATVEA